MAPEEKHSPLLPGITPTSLAAILLAMLAMGILIQVGEILVSLTHPAEHTLPIPAIIVFVAIALVAGLAGWLTGRRVLTRPERLCVLFSLLIAGPLMTQGFWHRIVSITATIPRMADFEKIDALSDRLWPHGRNLLAGALESPDDARLTLAGRVAWQEETIGEGRRASVPRLRNDDANQVSSIRIRLPRHAKDGGAVLRAGEPYLLSVLARARKLGPESAYFGRIYRDEETGYTEVFRSSAGEEITFLHKQGFRRVGAYRAEFPPNVREGVWLELGLSGVGELVLADPKLLNVAALETAYSAKQLIRQSDYDRLPADQRSGLVVKPDNMWSWAGVKFLLAGYIPVRDWVEPVLTWTAFVALVLTATLAVNVIMRRQWIEGERYQLPVTRVPIALLGPPEEPDEPVPSIWRNRIMWAGFGVALAWCLLRGWQFYNSAVPDTSVHVVMKDYFTDPGWGNTFDNVFFTVSAIFVAMAVFMELNVLGSLLIGFVLYRAQFWFGEFTGLGAHAGYPYTNEQQVGAYLVYAALVLVFSRRHLRRVLHETIHGAGAGSAGEMFSYRSAVLTLGATFVGIFLWAMWIGVPTGGMLAFFGFLVILGLVTAKVRAECGAPFGYFACWKATTFLSLLGGLTVFGPELMMVSLVASFFLCETVFFLIPGAQFELIELGRRYRVARRHLLYTAMLGLAGGMIVGGWVFLSNAYSIGGESVRYQWAFYEKSWYFFSFNEELQAASAAYRETLPAAAGGAVEGAAKAAEGIEPSTYAYTFGAVAAAATAIGRQVWAGFWFHPLGFILGMTRIMDYIWGSVLVALIIRSTVLWFGGAATVRQKLRPFFVGVFLGAVTSALLWGLYGAYLYSRDVERIYGAIP